MKTVFSLGIAFLPIDEPFVFLFNSFGLAPAAPLQILTPLAPNQSTEVSLPLNTVGSVMKMDPLNNLQVGPYMHCKLYSL